MIGCEKDVWICKRKVKPKIISIKDKVAIFEK